MPSSRPCRSSCRAGPPREGTELEATAVRGRDTEASRLDVRARPLDGGRELRAQPVGREGFGVGGEQDEPVALDEPRARSEEYRQVALDAPCTRAGPVTVGGRIEHDAGVAAAATDLAFGED